MKQVSILRILGYSGLFIAVAIAAFFRFEHRLPAGLIFEPSYDIPIKMRPPGEAPPFDASFVHGVPRDLWAAPNSNWLANERAIAEASLRRVDVALLVLPVQGDKNAFDPIERSLISRIVGHRIGEADVAIANPGMVIKYLGLNRALYPDAEIQDLVKIVNAERILVLTAQHDRHSLWTLSGDVIDAKTQQLVRSKKWQDLPFSDDKPPSDIDEEVLEEITLFAIERSADPALVSPNFSAEEFVFPEDIEDLIDRSRKSPLHAAAYLQLIGMLHPRGAYNDVRNHLFERSLVELRRVSPEASFYPYFKARAYAYLDRRPAALAAMDGETDPYFDALRAALNGDYPQLKALVEKMGTSPLDFMAWKDFQAVEYRHVDVDDHVLPEQFVAAHPAWAPFIYRSIRDYEQWADYSAVTMKLGLEQLLPGEAVSLEKQFARQIATGEPLDELDLTRILLRHIETFQDDEVSAWTSDPGSYSNISPADILDLAKTVAVANHLREVDEDLITRRLPEAALADIHEFDSLFSGHPAVTLKKGRALQYMAADSSGMEKENLLRESADTLLAGFAWTSALHSDAIRVARNHWDLLQESSSAPGSYNVSGPFSGYSRRYFELPRGIDWYANIERVEVQDGAVQRCVDYTWTGFYCLRWQIGLATRTSANPEKAREEILAANSHRFIGNPQRDAYEVEHARRTGDADAEIRLLQSQMEAGSTDWSIYYSLGRMYKRRGEYQAAQEIWLSYPGFREENLPVGLSGSNHADIAAAMLFWIGQHELALPLLEIAASSGTGSAASMTSAARLAQIHGDLETATAWSAERVRRYDNKYGMRDLLQLLHIQDQNDLAWNIFDQAQATEPNTQMWSGALVGHRMAGATIFEINDWLHASESRRTAHVKEDNTAAIVDLAARYLFISGTMDRVPDEQLADLISGVYSLDPPVYVVPPIPTDAGPDYESDEPAIVFIGKLTYRHDPLVPTPRDERRVKGGTEIDIRYTMLARALTAFFDQNYELAFEIFNETAYFFSLYEYLPYYAFAAAMVGHADHLDAVLEKREAMFERVKRRETLDKSSLGYRFDEDLTYAVLAAFRGQHDEATQYLRAALNNRPYMDERSIFPMYEIVDLAELLYGHTGHDVYRDFALEISRRHTLVLPMYAWAHFVVAKYSESAVERANAAASGLKLDPLSRRAKELPNELIDQAREILETRGAPYLTRSRQNAPLET